MKYTVNSRQPKGILANADEIRVSENDINKILDFIEDFPEKTIIYEFNSNFIKDLKIMNTLAMYNEKLENFIIDTKDIAIMDALIAEEFKVFWHYPVHTFFELRSLIEHEPCYIIIGEPLCFDLDAVVNITNIPLRMNVNYAYEPYLVKNSGICGKWVRPEDIELYEKYITTVDFYTETLTEEATLLKVYKDNKSWPGNLNLLIKHLNFNIDNRIIPKDLAEKRINCGQRCMRSGNCHACETAFMFAETMRKLHESRVASDEN